MLLKSKKRLTAYVLAALCVASTGFAATEHWNDASTTPKTVVSTQAGDANWEQWKTSWESIKNDYEQVSMAPGKDATQMNFAWYSMDKAKASEIRVSTNADMSGARSFLGTSKTGTVIDGTQYYTNKVTVKDLKPETTYYYQVKINGQWKDAQSFKTGKPDDFSFMYVGDPQLGASKGQTSSEGNKQDGELATRNDAYNWNKTLNSALSQHPEIDFLVSPGDQINEPAEDQSAAKIKLQEQQYAGYLSAKALRSLPEATSIGNHDSMTTGYSYDRMTAVADFLAFFARAGTSKGISDLIQPVTKEGLRFERSPSFSPFFFLLSSSITGSVHELAVLRYGYDTGLAALVVGDSIGSVAADGRVRHVLDLSLRVQGLHDVCRDLLADFRRALQHEQAAPDTQTDDCQNPVLHNTNPFP